MRRLTHLMTGVLFFLTLGELGRVSGRGMTLSPPAACAVRLAGEDDKAAKETAAFVRNLQDKSGGFLPNSPRIVAASPSLRATSSAVRALRYLGGEVPDLEACGKFVRSCYDADVGAFADFPGGKADVLANAIGIMAVVDLKLPVDKYSGAVKYLEEN